jgi:hypothetical protein
MYESTIDGFETMADVEAFIALARRCFENSGQTGHRGLAGRIPSLLVLDVR